MKVFKLTSARSRRLNKEIGEQSTPHFPIHLLFINFNNVSSEWVSLSYIMSFRLFGSQESIKKDEKIYFFLLLSERKCWGVRNACWCDRFTLLNCFPSCSPGFPHREMTADERSEIKPN